MPFDHEYTYDHNGNRLTETVNGVLAQSFTYNGHDVLASGIGETEGYDLNGNLTAQTISGQTTRFTWDDEDRLTGQSFPDGHTDAYAYNGLGMRLTKSDPTGSYSYFTDGAAPASDVLSDGHSSFTPGISEMDPSGDRFYLPDAQGNSRGLLDASQTATDGYNWDAFGSSVSRFGSNPMAFAWNGGSGYQSDGDSGLKLLGHRYYDSRTGRFISQDPAGSGNNWYAYVGNDPVNGSDPLGLSPDPNPEEWSINGGSQLDQYNAVAATAAQAGLSSEVAQEGGLVSRFNYYSVDRLTYAVTSDGKETGILLNDEHLFYFAVPKGTDLLGNLHAARAYAGTHYINLFGRSISMGHPTKADAALYVYHHFANATVGDFKDKQFPGLGAPRPGTRLWELADNGGNMNGGMGMQGLGMSSWEIALSGDVHIAIHSHGAVWHDDAMGAAVLQAGYSYASQQR